MKKYTFGEFRIDKIAILTLTDEDTGKLWDWLVANDWIFIANYRDRVQFISQRSYSGRVNLAKTYENTISVSGASGFNDYIYITVGQLEDAPKKVLEVTMADLEKKYGHPVKVVK